MCLGVLMSQRQRAVRAESHRAFRVVGGDRWTLITSMLMQAYLRENRGSCRVCSPCPIPLSTSSTEHMECLLAPGNREMSLRAEAQRTEAYALPLCSLRPCWTAFLSILRAVLLFPLMCKPAQFRRAHRVFPQPVRSRHNEEPLGSKRLLGKRS